MTSCMFLFKVFEVAFVNLIYDCREVLYLIL